MRRLPIKKVNYLYIIILFSGALIACVGAFIDKMVLSVLGVLIIFADIAFRLICYRCPYCGKYLDRSTGEFCPYCGKTLDE